MPIPHTVHSLTALAQSLTVIATYLTSPTPANLQAVAAARPFPSDVVELMQGRLNDCDDIFDPDTYSLLSSLLATMN